MKVGVIDYGAGNFQSVVRALRFVGAEPCAVGSPSDYEGCGATHLIFPGVGRASQAMDALRTRRLESVVRRHAAEGRPLLGICVGMQVLGRFSAEDHTTCLGLLDFELKLLECAEPVPHMGWNVVRFRPEHPLVGDGPFAQFEFRQRYEERETEKPGPSAEDRGEAHFYFVHSYAAVLDETGSGSHGTSLQTTVGTTDYGTLSFASVVGHKNVVGVQFHVEKSGRAGLQFLRDFLKMEALC